MIKITAKDERINELKHEIDSIRNEYESNNQTHNQLRIRIRELESNVNSYETVGNKSSITISALQQDNKEKQEQLIELQSRLRTHMEEREASERKVETYQKKLQELFSTLQTTLSIEFGQVTTCSFDQLVTIVCRCLFQRKNKSNY